LQDNISWRDCLIGPSWISTTCREIRKWLPRQGVGRGRIGGTPHKSGTLSRRAAGCRDPRTPQAGSRSYSFEKGCCGEGGPRATGFLFSCNIRSRQLFCSRTSIVRRSNAHLLRQSRMEDIGMGSRSRLRLKAERKIGSVCDIRIWNRLLRQLPSRDLDRLFTVLERSSSAPSGFTPLARPGGTCVLHRDWIDFGRFQNQWRHACGGVAR
jgi:hypothetical protein